MTVTEDDIVAFVAAKTGARADRVDRADILGASGIDGDDAFDLFEAYSEQFGVDMSGYVWDFHHADEGALLAGPSPVRPPHRRVRRIPVSAAMLARFANLGRWELAYPPFKPMRHRYDLLLSPAGLLLGLAIAALAIFGAMSLLSD